jgi:hypothetical protein
MRDGGREPDASRRRCERAEPRHAERELVAALGAGQRVDLVHHDRAEACRTGQGRPAGSAAAPGFGRGEQDLRRRLPLTRAAVLRRVAGAGLDPIGSPISDTGAERFRAMSTASALSGEM